MYVCIHILYLCVYVRKITRITQAAVHDVSTLALAAVTLCRESGSTRFNSVLVQYSQ